MQDQREFDIIVWGASGFTGKLVAEYLYGKYGVNQSVKWAMAGRNQEKLEKVRAEVADQNVPLIIADSHDEASLNAMVQKAKVICTTVGPYGKYGAPLVDACVKHQTHYCDLAGEVPFIRQSIDQHHETAKSQGTRIVHSCGFDSIPSDMGVYFIQKQAQAKTGGPASQIKMRVKAFKGGLSGGTYASINDTMEKAQQDNSLYSVLLNPYGLNPQGELEGPDKPDLQSIEYDDKAKTWIFPFIMAGINTRIVRRSNAVAGYPYGKEFRYEEATMAGDGEEGKNRAMQEGMRLKAMMSKPGSAEKAEVNKRMPKPGEGPSKAEREAGFYDLKFFTTFQDGSTGLGTVYGDRDPGYGSTSKMLAETAICLAQDELPSEGGVLTPSTAMGDALLKRLEDNAGLTFSFE
ncbi:MAG: saccharopine dehydrogenase NADP-binding domain-containing protein [Bacteroidota bacterium]